MNINPGELKERILITNTTTTQNGNGFDEKTISTVHSCYAKAHTLSGAENTKNNAEFAEKRTRFVIRYTKKAISEKNQVIYAGKTYDIEFVNDYNGKEYIEIISKINEKSR